jgi:hypothetical protein
MYDATVNNNEIKIIGRLPYLSDNLPRMGLKRNCIREKTATVSPISKSEIPSSLLPNVGSRGIRIPNPSKSIKTVTKITVSEALLLFI